MRKILQCISRICMLSIVALISMQSLSQNNQAEAHNIICSTPECLKRGRMYLSNMKQEVNPCHDFFEFACGNWHKTVQVPNHVEAWKIEDMFRDKANAVIQKQLENPAKTNVEEIERAKNFYRACMNLPHMHKLQAKDIKNIISRIGHWPMFLPNKSPKQSIVIKLPKNVQWWQINNEYMKLNGESALFDVVLMGDTNNNYQIATLIMELSSPYGMLHRTTLWGPKSPERHHYILFLKQLVKIIAPQRYNEAVMAKDLVDVMNFRDEIFKVHTRNILTAESEKEFTIKKLQEVYNKFPHLSETGKINWLETIRHAYGNGKDAYNRLIQPSTIVRVNMPYLKELAALLSRTPLTVIVNHIHLYFAERQIMITPSMSNELDAAYTVVDGHLDGFKRKPMSKSQYCIEASPMQNEITIMYAAAVLTNENINQVRRLIHHAKQIFKQNIFESPWLDQPTKELAMLRVGHILNSVAYPEWYDAPEALADADPFDVDPLNPEAYYVYLKNKIYISASLLRSPMYSPNLPFVINYGSTVSILGHELQHAFDIHDKLMADDDPLLLWSIEMLNKLVDRADCFMEQYSNYRRPYLQKYHLLNHTSIPHTLKEDIADVTGLKIAYVGYREKLIDNKGVCELLPGFQYMGCEKLFFIAYANTMCTYLSPVGEKFTLQVDSHSLPRIRVNGAVSNMRAFSNAFGCKPTDPMNLKRRCDIWNK